MPSESLLKAADFYDSMPAGDHRPGDIWSNLPTFGVPPGRCLRGIVITPACDLANKKCESITFLPILGANEYLGSSAFRYECWQEIQPLLSRLKGYGEVPEPGRFDLLPLEYLEPFLTATHDAAGKKLSTLDLSRIAGYCDYIKHATTAQAGAQHLSKFLKADKLESILSRMVTNALKTDIHFLPADNLPSSYSAIPQHALILFRYPFSIPIAVLSRAQNLTEPEWKNYVTNNRPNTPILTHMHDWPIKLASLRNEFLADMISRYINMYIRLGSSDFTDESVTKFSNQIREGA